ncbi:MAG: hypothetical protein U0P81_15050 [Holophagaceae bacterium]
MAPADLPFVRASLRPGALYAEAWARIKDRYALFLGVTFVGVLVGGLGPMGILMGPMMVGIFLCHRARARGEEVRFDLLFKGFDRFVDAFIAALLMMAASLVVVLPLVLVLVFGAVFGTVGLAAAGQHSEGLAGGAAAGLCLLWAGMIALILLASTLVNLLFTFAFPLLADRGLAGLDAVKLSFRAAWANLGGLVVLALATFALTFLGLMLCYVGALLLMPLTLGVHWIAYERVFGRAGEADLADFPA